MPAAFPDSERLYSLSETEDAIRSMAAEINAYYVEQKPIVVTVLNGGVVFAGLLMPHLQFDLELDYVHVTRYGDKQRGGELSWKAGPQFSPKKRDILLVDDILDEGNTLLALNDHFLKAGAREVRTAVLVDKMHTRKAQDGMRADFTGLSVPDRFVFGMGMDVSGSWRNAPGIYALNSK